MKPITALSVATIACLLPLTAQVTKTEDKTEVKESADGSVTEKQTTTTTTFNPEARTKVVKYFDTYKTNPHGLPPEWVTKMRVKEMPASWRTTVIAPGAVVTEKERPYLVEAPADLVSVLPPAQGGVRYYVAGGNVVAVDKEYRVVDSIRIPTVKFTMDD
jgi:hypothetical protein